jgi:hypothetical protein
MNKKNTTNRVKLGYYVATAFLLYGAVSFPAFAQKDSSSQDSSNSILELDLLRGTAADDITMEIPRKQYDSASDTSFSAKASVSINATETAAISKSDIGSVSTKGSVKEGATTSSDTNSNITVGSALNREPLSVSDANATDKADYWQNFEDNNSTANEQKDGSLISSLKFWFNQFFSFRNTQSSTSTLHINDLHTVTSKDSVWIGWVTNNLAFTRIYYSTTTPVEIETSKVNTTLQGATTATIKNLDLNTKYYYRILSKDIYGNTTVSEESSFITK